MRLPADSCCQKEWGYLSTLRVEVTSGGTGSRVEWSGEFTPKGVSDGEASRLFQGIYEDGLKALAAALGRGTSRPQ